MMTRSTWPLRAICTPLAPLSTAVGLEFLVQRKLLDQRLAQLGVVVDDQDLARRWTSCALRARRMPPLASNHLREVEHSGRKRKRLRPFDSIRKRHREGARDDASMPSSILNVFHVRAAAGLAHARLADRRAADRVRWHWAGAAFWPTSARATAARPAAATGCCGCGGGPDRGPRPGDRACRSGRFPADDAWCEDPADRRYNRPVRRSPLQPRRPARERDDHLYDLIIEIDHNTIAPHRARAAARCSSTSRVPGMTPTAGCVAHAGTTLLPPARPPWPHTRIDIR